LSGWLFRLVEVGVMSDAPRVVLRTPPGIATEQARDARARAWAFIFRCYQLKESPANGQSGRGNSDGTATTEDSADVFIVPD
jgi:hypothetical protein